MNVSLQSLLSACPVSPFGDVDREALAAFRKFKPPLRGSSLRHLGSVLRAARWRQDIEQVRRFSGLEHENHCLHTRALEWLWPLERQATEGLAYFLQGSDLATKLRRVRAFLNALAPPACGWPHALESAVIYAEHPTKRGRAAGAGRMDILVVATGEGRKVGAVIEAKFEHDLRNPLKQYERTAAELGLDERNCRFLVLGVRNDLPMRRKLQRERPWQFISWRRLLSDLEGQMRSEYDDDEYRRFRRTLFDRIL
jgi:hypothetical protein